MTDIYDVCNPMSYNKRSPRHVASLCNFTAAMNSATVINIIFALLSDIFVKIIQII